jgi:hypothetical protein
MMNDRARTGQAPSDDAGLCSGCAYVRLVAGARGTVFHLCRLSFVDAAFPRYPRIPVVRCDGFVAADEADPSPGG